MSFSHHLRPGRHTVRLDDSRWYGTAKAQRLFACWVFKPCECGCDTSDARRIAERNAAHFARRIPHLKTAKNRRRFLAHLNAFNLLRK